MSDMVVYGPLSDDIQSLLGWVACVAGAATLDDYLAVLDGAGFSGFTVEDQREALLEMVDGLRRRLLGVELAAGLGKIDLAGLDLDEAKRLARQAVELIENGAVGYVLIGGKKA